MKLWQKYDRNCSKYFPLKHSNDYRWTPEYRTSKGTPYYIAVECEECPVSLITADPQIMPLVQMVRQDAHAVKATGATLYGPVRSRWPAWWDDAVQVAERIRILEHNSSVEASMRELK